MELKYLQQISANLNVSVKQAAQVLELQAGGATIPFMARYRKEATGNLDEVAIGGIVEAGAAFAELEKRKETVVKTIVEAGKMTPELQARIEGVMTMVALEDLYLPYKPKRKTRASQAIEKGLEPLAKAIWEGRAAESEVEAAAFVNETVKDVKEALQGARDIMAEWISEDEGARGAVRQLFTRSATITSKVMETKKEEAEAQKYRDYFSFSEALDRCPAHRIMAIRRGEKEGYLLMDISVERTEAVETLQRMFALSSNPAAAEVRKAAEDAYVRLLKPSMENEFRLLSKTKADEEAISVFTENLRQLLLSSPLGAKRVLALDPGYRTGCKLVCLDEQGTLIHNSTIYPHPPQNKEAEAGAEVRSLVKKFRIEAIGIGNGTAGRETETFVRGLKFDHPVSVFSVNESGASIYSASEAAREEFPDQDVTVRGAVSIGRRLLDPLSELVKIDPKSIGVGQYQHDVNPTRLKAGLDRVVESAVNYVGVNVNTASKHLLQYVSGISASLAASIVQHRNANGPFKSRKDLMAVPGMGPKSFEQCAGFLRIPGGEHPLDNSSVHPERYALVESMAADVQASLEALLQDPSLRRRIDPKKYISETAGTFTVEDILKELEKPGRDPRAPIQEFRFEESIRAIDDVKTGMRVPGIVTNITAFGAFVDIGVKQDGLVHVSQLSNKFVSDPNTVVKLGQQVMVTVTEVDPGRKRIALSMKEEGGSTARTQQRVKPAAKVTVREEENFEDKLAQLKNRFKR